MKFPEEVPGWLTRDEGEGLAAFAEGCTVLEIGSFRGRSTVCLAQTARYLVSVDPRDARATTKELDGRNTLIPFLKTLYDYGLLGKVALHVGTTETVRPHLPWTFDRVFIDGDHSLQAVREDLDWARRLLNPGGLIACHDYRAVPGEHDGHYDAGVTAAVNESVAAGWQLLRRYGTVAVLRPPGLRAADLKR